MGSSRLEKTCPICGRVVSTITKALVDSVEPAVLAKVLSDLDDAYATHLNTHTMGEAISRIHALEDLLTEQLRGA